MTLLIIAGIQNTDASLSPALQRAGMMTIDGSSPCGAGLPDFQSGLLAKSGINPESPQGFQSLAPDDIATNSARMILQNLPPDSNHVWADSGSASLLDFWHAVNPDVRFLLGYTPPWVAIEYFFTEKGEMFREKPEQAIACWLGYNRALIKFYRLHRGSCLLVNYAEGYLQTDELVNLLNEKFHLDLAADSTKAFAEPLAVKKSVYSYMLGMAAPESIELYLELESCADLCGREADFDCQEYLLNAPSPQEVMQQWYRAAGEEKLVRIRLPEVTRQLETALQDQAGLCNQIDDLKTGMEDAQRDMQSIQSKLNKSQTANEEFIKEKEALKQEISALTESLSEQKQESELLLLQLHQVQEELEHYFLRHQELESSVAQKQAVIDEKQGEINQLTRTKREYESRLALNSVELEQLKCAVNGYKTLVEDYNTNIREAQQRIADLYLVQHEQDRFEWLRQHS